MAKRPGDEKLMANRKNNKYFWQEEIFGQKMSTVVIAVVVVLVAILAANHYGVFDSMSVKPDDVNKTSSDLVLDKEFKSMTIGNKDVADPDTNYNSESGVIAVQIDAEKTNNSTHTFFKILAVDVDGKSYVVTESVQSGILSTPTKPVTATVTAEIGMNYASGFTNTNEILSSSVTASAPSMKTADGEVYYPVVLKNNKTAVYVNDVLNAKSFSWTVSNTSQTALVAFDLDWEGIDKMTSISDEIQIPVKFSNTDDPETLKIRIIKNAVINFVGSS